MSKRLKSNDPSDIEDWVRTEIEERNEAAFVGGDADAHRLEHASMHKDEAATSDLKRTLVKNSTWGLLAGVLMLNWEAIKIGLKAWFK